MIATAARIDAPPPAREIAEMVRRRPIGAVLVDICRDLGIDLGHLVPILLGTSQRIANALQEMRNGLAPNPAFYARPDWLARINGPPAQRQAA